MKLAATILMLMAVSVPAAAVGPNFIKNGDFENGPGENNRGWLGWHTAILGCMPRIVDTDEEGKHTFNYICSCGHNFGTVKPEAGVMCPDCRRFSIGEETGTWYDNNHEIVTLGPGKSGYGVKMLLSKEVGNNQGTRCVSDLYRVSANWPYRFSLDARAAKGASLMAWVEGYREVELKPWEHEEEDDEDDDIYEKEEAEAAADEAVKEARKEEKTAAMGTKIEKCYRKQIAIGSPDSWKHYEVTFIPPPRYQIDWILVKLYAFVPTETAPFPSEAYFDNVEVRPLSPREAQSWIAKQKPKKDKRFR